MEKKAWAVSSRSASDAMYSFSLSHLFTFNNPRRNDISPSSDDFYSKNIVCGIVVFLLRRRLCKLRSRYLIQRLTAIAPDWPVSDLLPERSILFVPFGTKHHLHSYLYCIHSSNVFFLSSDISWFIYQCPHYEHWMIERVMNNNPVSFPILMQ